MTTYYHNQELLFLELKNPQLILRCDVPLENYGLNAKPLDKNSKLTQAPADLSFTFNPEQKEVTDDNRIRLAGEYAQSNTPNIRRIEEWFKLIGMPDQVNTAVEEVTLPIVGRLRQPLLILDSVDYDQCDSWVNGEQLRPELQEVKKLNGISVFTVNQQYENYNLHQRLSDSLDYQASRGKDLLHVILGDIIHVTSHYIYFDFGVIPILSRTVAV